MSRYFTLQPDTSEDRSHPLAGGNDLPRRTSAKKRKKSGAVNKATVQKHKPTAPSPAVESKAAKYKRTGHLTINGIKTRVQRRKIQAHTKKVRQSVLQAARAELLLPEDVGYLQADDGEETFELLQRDIADAVDITSCTKYFDLDLPQFGPYSINYSRESRHLLLGGGRGHVAALDWVTKRLLCETNVMESVHAVQWLHMPTMFAVAQKSWTYIYDSQGIELHCLKAMDSVLRMTFLPYHFLLVTASEKGFLSWLDTSVGKMVASFNARSGRLNVMKQNPYNAVVLTGHTNGVVKMWTPNMAQPAVSMLCAKAPVRDLAVDQRGVYLATVAADRTLKIWDVRTYRALQMYKLQSGPGHVTFSQKDMVALSLGSCVEVYKDCCRKTVSSPYLRHKTPGTVSALEFCPYEDVLGIGHQRGFTSILVPGSGEPNFDAFESNPYMTKQQRKEMEVKALLEKVQPELICLDPKSLGKVNVEKMQEKVEEANKKLWVRPRTIDYTPKVGKRSAKAKRALRDQQTKAHVKQLQQKKRAQPKKQQKQSGSKNVLDRFKPK
uniref:Putative wd40-repeat-containing subunit of the 18s rrna processing complex n=1 Tax=Hyalomma excavatum TaxID=257692 RepID=A0A131XHQ9_9ACAR